ncbi:hypothetical protein WJX75_000350 [Coccomyxa subellipsoidea]|uniref:Uncharacterized protein n=1 Tax=Coccomyxa subellipsoidea TaxID=248742 RepID=A0ABR2YAL2_9CHLO
MQEAVYEGALTAAFSSSSGKALDWPAIRLTGRQVEQLGACRRTLIDEVVILAAEWERLCAQLKDIEDFEESAEGSVIRFGEVTALTMQLCANVHAIITCRHFYPSYVYTRVLSPVPMAQFFVALYPMGPDMLYLTAFLAIRANKPSTSKWTDTVTPKLRAEE